MLTTIPIINNKGGVGKTTTAVNVAAGLAHRGRQVLLVDLDSQGSASISLGVHHDNLSPSSADVLFGDATIHDAIRPTNNGHLDLLTGSLDLANADVRLKEQERGQHRLATVLEQVESTYDQIIVDCAPSTSILSINALVAADAFIIPVVPSYLSLEGVVNLGKVVRKVRRQMGEAAPVLGLLLTKVDRSRPEVNDAISQVRNHYGGKVFDVEIEQDPTVEEAPGYGQDLFTFAPESQGAEDYQQLLDEIETRLDRYGTVFDRIAGQGDNGSTIEQAAPA
jgi:chromosome partitioning protein